jgi:hypothetical protein
MAAAALAGTLLYPARSLLAPWAPRRYFPPDMMQFHWAGKLAARGEAANLYHRASYEPLFREALADGEWNGPCVFNRPAFAAFLWIPLAGLSYRNALFWFTAGNLVLWGVLMWKLPAWFALPPVFRVCLFAFLPFLLSAAIGQDTLLVALLLAYSFRLAANGKPVWAGAALALCLMKPHLVWAAPLALLGRKERRMLYSFLAAGGLLAAVSAGAVGAGGIREWIDVLKAPSTNVQPWTMANVRAVALHIGPGAAWAAAFLVLACFGAVLYRGSFEQKFGAAIITSLLLNPHTYVHDLSLLAVAAAIAGPAAAQFLILLPWPYFYPREDSLGWIAAGMAVLGISAWRPAWKPRTAVDARRGRLAPLAATPSRAAALREGGCRREVADNARWTG